MKKLKQAIMITVAVVFFALPVCADENETGAGLKNIEVFTRLYGYVRYFYPGDEAVATDWDRFAVYGVKQVEKARDRAELKKILEELFLPIAPALLIHETNRETTFSTASLTPPGPPGSEEMKVVAWQHLGVGFGNPQDIFRSIRLNRADPLALKFGFGTIAKKIPAAPYQGKEIKLKAAVKVSEGIGQLFFQVERTGNQEPFIKDMDETPIRSDQWQDYEITLPVPDDVAAIYYGCLLSGPGQLWADDFRLYARDIENQTQGQWKLITSQNPGFEEDREGAVPTGWIAKSELYSFQVTGSTAARGSKSMTIKSKSAPLAKPLFAEKPGIGEYIAKELGSGLSCVMPIALYGTGTRTLPRPVEEDVKRLQEAVKRELPGSKDLTDHNPHVRLAGIVIAWNVLQHFYPYFDEVKTDWQKALIEALESAYKDKSQRDFLETLRKMTARLKDGQAGAYLSGNIYRMYLPPMRWDWVQGQLVITDIYEKTLTDVHVGDVVRKVDEKKAGEALAIKERAISAATSGWKRFRALEELLRGAKNTKIHLNIKRDRPSVFYNETVSRSAFSPKYYGYLEKQKKQSGKIGEGVYYLNLDITPMEEINRLMPELQKARSIICDLRGYPKGSHPLLCHLIKKKKSSNWMWIPQVIYPDYEKVTYKKVGWDLEPLKPFLTAKMIFIADTRTIGYGESILNYIEHHKLGTIVGQPTAGTNGNVNSFYLFGKYFICWTGTKAVKLDGSPHHGKGIIPHVRVERTLKGIKEGRDQLLEKAIEIAKQ